MASDASLLLLISFLALRYIRQQLDVTADLEEMETESSDSGRGAQNGPEAEQSYSMMRLLKTKDLRWPLFIAVFLQVIQQLSGINGVTVSQLL